MRRALIKKELIVVIKTLARIVNTVNFKTASIRPKTLFAHHKSFDELFKKLFYMNNLEK